MPETEEQYRERLERADQPLLLLQAREHGITRFGANSDRAEVIEAIMAARRNSRSPYEPEPGTRMTAAVHAGAGIDNVAVLAIPPGDGRVEVKPGPINDANPARKPYLGAVVLYRLTEDNAYMIAAGRQHTGTPGNPVTRGQAVPMIVTAVMGEGIVRGRVLLDGEDYPTWVRSAGYGVGPGTWTWPTTTTTTTTTTNEEQR